MATIHRTLAEQEVTFRYDQAERVAWFGTTTPWVARRWQRARVPVVVVIRYPDGTPASWEAKLAWSGRKAPWLRLVSLSLPVAARKAGSGAGSHPTERLPLSNGARARGLQV